MAIKESVKQDVATRVSQLEGLIALNERYIADSQTAVIQYEAENIRLQALIDDYQVDIPKPTVVAEEL